MTTPTPCAVPLSDHKLLRLARELAMDIHPVETILQVLGITSDEYRQITGSAAFQRVLSQELENWNGAVNTAERVKLKSLAFVEEALPEFFVRAHDPKESLRDKVETLKTVARFAGVGATVEGGVIGEKVTVTINLGADQQLRVEKQVTPQVIDLGPEDYAQELG